jgi:hypothetical protein
MACVCGRDVLAGFCAASSNRGPNALARRGGGAFRRSKRWRHSSHKGDDPLRAARYGSCGSGLRARKFGSSSPANRYRAAAPRPAHSQRLQSSSLRCRSEFQLAGEDVSQKWPVSKRVNSSRTPDDDPTLIEKIDLGAYVRTEAGR